MLIISHSRCDIVYFRLIVPPIFQRSKVNFFISAKSKMAEKVLLVLLEIQNKTNKNV